MATMERPALGVGDYVKGHCSVHDHHAEGYVLDDDRGKFRVRFEDALGTTTIHLMAREECVLVQRAVEPSQETPAQQAVCYVCGETARYRVVETMNGSFTYTPVCKFHRRAAKNMGYLTTHQDMVGTL